MDPKSRYSRLAAPRSSRPLMPHEQQQHYQQQQQQLRHIDERPLSTAEIYPKRVIWMQEEDTGKWMLVGLTDKGEVQDPRDYEDIHVPIPNQPSGRVWMRDEETGKWSNQLVEASKEELARAETAIRKRAFAPKEKRTRGDGHGRPSSSLGLASIHQSYAHRMGAHGSLEEEEEDQLKAPPCPTTEIVDGVRYHNVKPSDTFNFICLKYKVSAEALRGANDFIGSTLQYAPERLVIPPPTQKKKAPEPPKRVEPTKVESEEIPEDHAVQSVAPSTASPAGVSSLNRLPSQEKSWEKKKDDDVQYHWVEPDDSLRWICLKYKLNANDLRRANNFTGSNLKLAPKKLIIPKSTSSNSASARSRPPRTRKLNRSTQSEYFLSSFRSRESFGSSIITMDSIPIKAGGMLGDDVSDMGSVAGGSVAGSLASLGVDSKMPHKAVLFEAKHECDASDTGGTTGENNGMASTLNLSYPENLMMKKNSSNGGGASYHDHNNSYQNLGSQGSELAMAPVSMVHVAGARKLYDQMSCDSNSIDSAEEGDSAPADIGKKGEAGSALTKTRYHDVRPTDTVEYLCLKYRVSASSLRRANIGLTGRNLQTGPKRLIIPPSSSSGGNSDTNYRNKETQDTMDTRTVSTHDDDTNTIALSDGQSTLTEQMASVGVDEEEDNVHHVQPSDTLQGICLQYGVSAYELRRANNFRGMNLRSAPDRLVIPRNEHNQPASKDFKIMTQDEKIQALLAHLPVSRMSKKPLLSWDEARAYLEFNEWSFERALRNAKVDAEWSSKKERRASVR